MIRLGVPQSGYNVTRNIVSSLPSWASRVRPYDRRRIKAALRYRCGLRVRRTDVFTFEPPFWPRVDLLHFFNSVTTTTTPWITTFEEMLPRWHEASVARQTAGMRWLLSGSCRRLIAFSDAARNSALNRWAGVLPHSQVDHLLEKTEVLLPPQAVICTYDEKPAHPEILFAFVGRDFYRKGGLLCLEALVQLAESKHDGWRAVFVGDLNSFGDYASRTSRDDRTRALTLIEQLQPRVRHHRGMAATAVIQLLRDSDYYLLPTYGDTFGYSVLEAQACGAIPIVTNVRSLPEIVSESDGFVISLDLDRDRDAHTVMGRSAMDAQIVEALTAALGNCLAESRDERWRKSAIAQARLTARHNPSTHADRIAMIYQAALRSPAATGNAALPTGR